MRGMKNAEFYAYFETVEEVKKKLTQNRSRKLKYRVRKTRVLLNFCDNSQQRLSQE
jgi:hypothetical protein